MATWRQQALIEAPVEDVWDLLTDPVRYPEWNEAIEVTGVPTEIEKGSTYLETARTPLGFKATTRFEVEELDRSLREIKLRCQTSGFYSRWVLTEAQGDTFADVEFGLDPHGLSERLWSLPHTKGNLRRLAERAIDGMRQLLGGDAAVDEATAPEK
jgi:hypothetical protein